MDETIRRYGILVTMPGEKYQYSNLGFGILDYVIERASGASYPTFMRKEVFGPLGMEHTAIPASSAELDRSRKWAVRYWNLDTPLPFYTFDHPGASAVYSCAHDLVRFGMFHLGQLDKAILSEGSRARMQQPIGHPAPGAGYGLGWGLDESRMGARTVSHTGGMGGVATSLVLAPEEGLAVAVLSNGSTRLPHEISHEIFAALLPEYRRNLAKSRAAESKGDSQTQNEIPRGLQGVWQGHVQTYQARLPFHLEITGPREAEATLAGAAPTSLENIRIENGFLTASMEGDIGTPDANRRVSSLRLSLKQRGDILDGAITAVGKPSPKLPNALTSWIELLRTP
jgi:hypothetical protein